MKEFVFIVTYGRSGSTVIQRLLNSFPGYHIKGENFNALYPLFLSYRQCRKAREEMGHKTLDIRQPWFGADKLDPEQYAKALVDVFIKEILQPPEEAQVIGFKEIRYYYVLEEFEAFMEFVETFFAPAKFIFNTRPLDAVVKSKWWATMDEGEVRNRLGALNDKFTGYASEHPETSLMMDHGVWSQDTTDFKRLTDFLGVPHDQAAIDQMLTERLTY